MSDPDQQPREDAPAGEVGPHAHSTRVALVAFYVGMALMIAIPSTFVAVVGKVSSPERLGTYAPFVLLPFAVPVILTIVPRTRRFGRYLLLGMVSTALVITIVGGGVLWILVSTS